MSIKHLREQPLLVSPAPMERRWWEVSAEDEARISKWMASFRKANNPPGMLQDFYYMRELGFQERIAPQERERVMSHLHSCRENRQGGFEVAGVLYHLRVLDLPSEITIEGFDNPPTR